MGNVITTPQQPPKDNKAWLNFQQRCFQKTSSLPVAGLTLAMTLLFQVMAYAQPCNPSIDATIAGDATICTGDNTNLTVTINGGMSPYMVVYNDGTNDFIETNYMSATDIAVSPTMTTTYELTSVTDDNGCSVPMANLMGDATVSVESVQINTQPMDVTDCAGESVTFSVSATNSGSSALTYQWQISTDNGANFNPILGTDTNYSGTTSSTLNIIDIMGLNANQYQVLIGTAVCSAVSSTTATLTVEGEIVISTEPADVTVCTGDGTSFMVVASNAGAGSLTYQWQVSSDNGANYSNLLNSATYSGVNTPTLNISDASNFNNYRYQVIISTNTCTETSNFATLSLEGPINIVSHPMDAARCAANPVSFSVSAMNVNGGSLAYVWEESTDNGVTFMPIIDGGIYGGASTNTLSINNTTGLDQNQYRVQISTQTCANETSNIATLTVEGPLMVTSPPMDVTVCSGASTSFTGTVSNGGGGIVAYQWQVKNTSAGSIFTDVLDDAIYDDVTTTTLVINDATGLDSFQYRLVAFTNICTVVSNPATLTVEGPIMMVEQPTDVTACSSEMVSFSSFASFSGAGAVQYQWQISTDNGTNFNNIPVGAPYSGTMSTLLMIDPIAGLGGNQYRLEASSPGCQTVYSDAATLTENTAPTVTASGDSPLCQNETIDLMSTVANGTMPYTHLWEIVNPQPVGFNGTGVLMDETMATATFRGIQTGMIRLSYMATGADACSSIPAFVDVEILATPAVNSISGNNTVCPVQTETYTVIDNPGSTYQWTLNSGGMIVGSSTDVSVTVEWGSTTGGPHDLILVETFTNSCSTENVLGVSIVDLGAPTFTCVGDQTFTTMQDGTTGNCEYLVINNSLDVTIDTEDCGIASVTHDYNGGGTTLMGESFSVGTTVVTWTVSDLAGNTATCNFSVTVTDDEVPVFTNCPTDITVNNDNNECSAVVTFSTPSATDNCAITGISNQSPINATTGQAYASGDIFPVGTTTLLFQATDAAGNTTDCTFDIMVNDAQLPVAICKNITVELDNTGMTTIMTADIDNNSSDNCEIVAYMLDNNNFTCIDLGTNDVILTVEDGDGNQDECTATVTVEDNDAPNLTCPANFTANACSIADVPPYANYSVFQNEGGNATDNCTLDEASFTHISDVSDGNTCPEVVTRTYRIADAAGNTATCVQEITIQDIQFPSIVIPASLTVGCDEPTNPNHTGMATFTDNCGSVVVNFEDDILEGSCAQAFTIIRTWTVADACGNSVSANQQIIVEDNDAPVFDVAATDLNLDCSTTADVNTAISNWLATNGGASASDNCGTIEYTNNYNGLSDACGVTGTANVTFTATDGCGNSATTSAVVSLVDNDAPVWTTNPSNITIECDEANLYSAWLNNNGNSDVNDACGDVEVTFEIINETSNCPQSVTRTIEFTATDDCGNASIRTATAVIQDTTAPIFDQTPPVYNNITCGEIFPNQVTLTATDNCGDVTITASIDAYTESCDGYTVTYRWVAEDECNNQTILTRSFEVLPDTEGPEFVAFPADMTVDVNELSSVTEQGVEEYLIAQNLMEPVVMDACGGTTLTFGVDFLEDDLACPVVAIYDRLYIAIDDCDNITNRVFRVRVVDGEDPIALCQATTVTLNQNGTASITAADIDGGSSVNCGNINFSLSQDQFNQNDLGDNVVALTVSDDSGNSATCNATVTVIIDNGENILAGNIATESGSNLANVEVNWMVNGQAQASFITGGTGDYQLMAQNGDDVEIRPFKNTFPKNGLSTFDLVIIHQHVLNINLMPSPYQRIAADANRDGVITTGDMIQIQSLILNNLASFPNNTSWRFAVANPALQNPTMAAQVPAYDEALMYNNVNMDELNGDFVAIKIGDVSGNALVNNFGETYEVENRSNEQVILEVNNFVFNNGITKDRLYQMNLNIRDFKQLMGGQLGLRYNKDALQFKGIETKNIPGFNDSNLGLNEVEEGIIRLNWWNQEAITLADESTLFTLTFKAKKDLKTLNEPIVLDEDILRAEAYTADRTVSAVMLRDQKKTISSTEETKELLELYQNTPNPFSGETIIGFYLPTASTAELTILDAMGSIIKTYKGDYPQGFNELPIDLSGIAVEGTLVYQLKTPTAIASKFMIKVK